MSVNSWSWIVFRVEVDEDCWQAGSVAKILVVGDVPELGAYHLHGGITLQNQKGESSRVHLFYSLEYARYSPLACYSRASAVARGLFRGLFPWARVRARRRNRSEEAACGLVTGRFIVIVRAWCCTACRARGCLPADARLRESEQCPVATAGVKGMRPRTR